MNKVKILQSCFVTVPPMQLIMETVQGYTQRDNLVLKPHITFREKRWNIFLHRELWILSPITNIKSALEMDLLVAGKIITASKKMFFLMFIGALWALNAPKIKH